MGVANVPSAAGGGIKSVQRGSAAGAGNVTISAVNTAKSFVTVFGTASTGAVAATGAIGATTVANAVQRLRFAGGGNYGGAATLRTVANIANEINLSNTQVAHGLASYTDNIATTNITGGTNNLVAAVVQGFLADSTTLTVSGACRWEVVEFA